MIFMILIALSSNPTHAAQTMAPPIATQKEHKLEKHGDVRNDEYFWLKDRKSPEVINYLKAENSYLQKALKSTEKLQKDLFKEMKSRIKEDDSTYPLKDGPYYYYTRFEKAKQYPIFARKTDLSAKEEILFNVNDLAKGKNYYSANYSVSPNHKIAALTFDSVGRRFYNIKFKDLSTGKFLKNEIKSVTNNLAWSADNKSIFYIKQDPNTLRWYQVYRYNLDTKKSDLVYEEKQDTFEAYVSTSLVKKHIFINISSTLSNEVRIIPSDKPLTEPILLFAREKEHEFSVTEDEDYFYILTNKNAKDFKILRTPISKASFANAETWLPHRSGTHIDTFAVFKNNLVIASRENGLTQLEIFDKKTKKQSKLNFEDSAYTVELGANAEYDTNSVRYVYYSLRSPSSIFDYEFASQQSVLRKVKEVPTYNADNYISERIFAKARDGRKVPISILMKKGQKLDATAPLLVYGYGSYGATMDPWFSSKVLSLVDRGYIFAIAHIRGGGEMGRYWTDEGRTLNKKNTFFDFIDCTEHLINKKYANPKKVFAMGGSAGGLLMGAIANYRPDLYKGIIAQVPFVDVVTTMLDDSIPLTTSEYDEWGNPNEKKFYDYIKSYSPYDNVSKQAYPNLLITTGLHDSQVQYWEPAKWTARLRKMNTSNNFIFLKTDMEAGHGGKTGRFDQLKDDALEYAFILEMENK
ncbi:MAG: S9 family peptidase [Bdellovibrionota bacterium]